MKYIRVFVSVLVLVQFVQAQDVDFHSPENIRKFADYLFCDGDYLRASLEYETLPENYLNDSIYFRTALTYSKLYDYSLSTNYFSIISDTSRLYDLSILERLKLFLLQSDFKSLEYFYTDMFVNERSELNIRAKKLFNVSLLLSDGKLPDKNDYLSPFDNDDETISSLYNWKQYPPYKSPVLAGIMSAFVPGSGKVYSGEIGDGIVGFLTTAVFSFIAYDNFIAGHNTRGWIWAAVAGIFYAGNVYGSVAAAQIYNAKITFEFNEEINIYLNNNNYFIPGYDFCR